eukprot:11572226-Alexandrium_andersonii.AAC.1
MSASLVGSEMCIRDSSLDLDLRNGGLRLWPIRSHGKGRLDSLNVLGPVSYTHLTLPTICSV